jgi:hypothetical protein
MAYARPVRLRWQSLLAFLVIACGSPAPTDEGTTPPASPATSIASLDPAGTGELDVTYLERWQARLPTALAQASAFERGLIADGVVTAEEHELAIISLLDCIRRAGLQLSELKRRANGLIEYWAVDGTVENADPNDDPVLRCQAEFYTYAREGFTATTLDPSRTERQTLLELAACLRERGFSEVPEAPPDIAYVARIMNTIAFNDHAMVRHASEASHACNMQEVY